MCQISLHLLNTLSHQDYSEGKQLLATITKNTNPKDYITVFFEIFLPIYCDVPYMAKGIYTISSKQNRLENNSL